jgi:hypothetical protein
MNDPQTVPIRLRQTSTTYRVAAPIPLRQHCAMTGRLGLAERLVVHQYVVGVCLNRIGMPQMTAILAQYAIPLIVSGFLAWFNFWAGQKHAHQTATGAVSKMPPPQVPSPAKSHTPDPTPRGNSLSRRPIRMGQSNSTAYQCGRNEEKRST